MQVRRTGRWWLAGLGSLAVIACGALWAFHNVGKWLVVQDNLKKAQAIVVLSGITPYRAIEAAQIYRQGWAPEVWLFRDDPRGASAAFASLGIHHIPEEEYDREVLEHLGVPASAIRTMDAPTTNTESEFELLRGQLRSRSDAKVILVTSPLHTRRVKVIWQVVVGKNAEAIVRHDTSEPTDPAHWWRATSDTQDVLHEMLGLINARMGFLVKPTTL